MRKNHFIDVIYTHTEGEPTCIVYGGVPYPYGTGIVEKRRHLEANYDWLRRALTREPRGHKDMFGVFLAPPSSSGADAGMIWMDGENFHDMCGHGTIALGMAMVSQGLTPSGGDLTTIRFETTAGLVTAEVGSSASSVEWCRFENVPAYLAARDVKVVLPDFGEIKVDVSFGGNFFAIVKWDHPDWKICPQNAGFFSKLGPVVKGLVNEKVELRHPTQPHINNLEFVTFYHEPTLPDAFYKCVHVFSDGKADRSPGGTGTSAMMAMLEARGLIKVGQTIQSEGLLGTGTFEGCLVGETELGGHRAVIPTIKGKANITGYAKWLIDPDDPVGEGFVVS